MALPSEVPELLAQVEDVEMTVPDELTHYFLNRGGADCKDVRLLRLISVATQRFAAEILDDCLQICKTRRQIPAARLKEAGFNPKDKRVTLTTEILSQVLQEYGITVKHNMYHVEGTDPKSQASGT